MPKLCTIGTVLALARTIAAKGNACQISMTSAQAATYSQFLQQGFEKATQQGEDVFTASSAQPGMLAAWRVAYTDLPNQRYGAELGIYQVGDVAAANALQADSAANVTSQTKGPRTFGVQLQFDGQTATSAPNSMKLYTQKQLARAPADQNATVDIANPQFITTLPNNGMPLALVGLYHFNEQMTAPQAAEVSSGNFSSLAPSSINLYSASTTGARAKTSRVLRQQLNDVTLVDTTSATDATTLVATNATDTRLRRRQTSSAPLQIFQDSDCAFTISDRATNVAVDAATATVQSITPTATQSSSSAASLSPISATAAAANAAPSASTFQLPGQKIAVVPIGLGVFLSVTLIFGAIIGFVTWERKKHQKAFVERKRLSEKP
ncbi:uncharacterized protein L969DRAFT_344929 [Mixia osmundae IAM 14324]|uniref:Uncharacterized protein n=1 Tax=Mixia osmundae (strain CBS 9802 / IAM 14324 / JCM 22182 / KY 12970) TaxID=764103 RepID=G7E5W1_MIXOS|nr:uncharacterized protein L969DRAFT_344929 [Mixia osmundae IAM 14324]KEI40627.1 hypothetical protein L969DRAFT_344929 [Mixia osmundae IAM 14324]GAA98221.1 hypothetical protein E5Q_04904 [Mixia osmundae IAM 14324]